MPPATQAILRLPVTRLRPSYKRSTFIRPGENVKLKSDFAFIETSARLYP